MPGPLKNAKHEAFAQAMALLQDVGPTYAKIYRVKKASVAASAGNRLLQNVDICSRVAELQGATATSNTLTAIERRERLARYVRADVPNIDLQKDGDLIQEITRTHNKDGSVTIKVKLPGKRECIMADAELSGDLERVGTDLTVNVAVAVMSEDRRADLMRKKREAIAARKAARN